MKKVLSLYLICSSLSLFAASNDGAELKLSDEKKHELLIKIFFDQYIGGPRNDFRGPQESDLETCYANIKDCYWSFYESLRTTQPQAVIERAQAFARFRSAFDVEAAKRAAASTVQHGRANPCDASGLICMLLRQALDGLNDQRRAYYAVLQVEQMYAFHQKLAAPALAQEQFHAQCLPLLKKAWIAGGQQIQEAECQELRDLLQAMGLREIPLKNDVFSQAIKAYQQEGQAVFGRAIKEVDSYTSL